MPRIHAAVLHEQALLSHDAERALDLHHQALRIAADRGLSLLSIGILESLALIAWRRDAPEAAGVLAGAAERARSDAGAKPRSLLCDPDLGDAKERGRSLALGEAIAYAARARGRRRRPDSGWESLTPTERSVVELAVQGLSNPEIAARLIMSRGTVKTHLAHVYAKLQVANRTELARLSSENGKS